MIAALESISLLLTSSALAIYALAFVIYTLATIRVPRSAPVEATEGSTRSSAPDRGPETGIGRVLRSRVGTVLTILGGVLHAGGVVLRGIAAGHAPWTNLYEFASASSLVFVLVFVATHRLLRLPVVSALVLGAAVLMLGGGLVNYYVPIVALAPSLQSTWLIIHVFVAMLATALYTLAAILTILQLLRTNLRATERWPRLRRLPEPQRLEDLAYRFTITGFILWTFTIIAGAIWAERAWGRYWGWDVKEVWSFVIWVIYAGYIHARVTVGWLGARAAWMNLTGFVALTFSFGIVNVYFSGLHAYSGLN